MRAARGPIALLFASLVIVMVGFGIVLPILPYYVTHFGASGRALGLLISIYSIMQFVFAPLWGRLSDRLGRKPVLLIGLGGYALAFALQGLAQDLTQLLLARAVAGVLSSATLPTALAYVADTTPARDRSEGMGLMGAAMGLGMVFGPVLGGPLTRVVLPLHPTLAGLMQRTIEAESGAALDLSFPFLVSAALALLSIPLVVWRLPESLPPGARMAAAGPRPSRARQIGQALTGPMAFLYLAAFLLAFALANLESVLGLYGQDRFALTPTGLGLLMGLIGVLSVIQQALLIGPLTRRFGEVTVLRAGLALSGVGLIGLALAPHFWQMVVLAAVFGAGNALLRPSVAALISQRAETGQGAAMGMENSFLSLGRVAGPLWGGLSYDWIDTAPFWTAAAIQLAALALSYRGLGPAAAGQPEADLRTEAAAIPLGGATPRPR